MECSPPPELPAPVTCPWLRYRPLHANAKHNFLSAKTRWSRLDLLQKESQIALWYEWQARILNNSPPFGANHKARDHTAADCWYCSTLRGFRGLTISRRRNTWLPCVCISRWSWVPLIGASWTSVSLPTRRADYNMISTYNYSCKCPWETGCIN